LAEIFLLQLAIKRFSFYLNQLLLLPYLGKQTEHNTC